MKFKDASIYRRMEHKHPAGIVLAFETPEKINAVVLYEKWRFRIVRELTRDQFEEELRKQQTFPDFVAGVVPMSGSKVLLNEGVDTTEVPARMKYFYAAELV